MITPLRDQVYVELTANEAAPTASGIQVQRLERQPSTRAVVLAIGEDVRNVAVGERVIISRLQGIEVGDGKLLIAEDAVLAGEDDNYDREQNDSEAAADDATWD